MASASEENTRPFFSQQLQSTLLHSDQTEADFSTIESHENVRHLNELFADDTSILKPTRDDLWAAIMRSPNVVHTAGELTQLLEASNLATVHRLMCQGLKLLTDGGSGRPKKTPTPTQTSTSYSSASGKHEERALNDEVIHAP